MQEIHKLRVALKMAHRALAHLSRHVFPAQGNPGGRLSRACFSARPSAPMVLLGRYMGYMRQLNPRQKAQVRRIRAAEGVRVAVQKARQLTS